MGFLNGADRGFGSVGLAEVIRNRSDVTASGGLADREELAWRPIGATNESVSCGLTL